jgi:hypothetical protein
MHAARKASFEARLIYRAESTMREPPVVRRHRSLAATALYAGLVLVGTWALIFVLFQGVDLPETWIVPEGYQGWLRMQYLDPSCSPLTRSGLVVVTRFNAEGYACTSDDSEHGWHGFGMTFAQSRSSVPRDMQGAAFSIPDRHRQVRFVGPAEAADVRQLPQDWR